jgi:hypothetical protein
VGFILAGDSAYFPEYDPDGSRLTAIVEAAAVRYNRILRDNWSVSLAYRYAPPGTTPSLATSAVHSSTDVTLPDGRAAERALHASIVFNAAASWYFDPTPHDDSEFDFSSEMYAQLSQERQHLGFIGDVPPRLETSYEGVAIGGAAGIDALSVALHEMGHVLGVVATFSEAADGDYDLNPLFLGGAEVAVLTLAGDPNHLQVRGSLMDPSIAARTRTLPSATDVFAMAAASGWQQIDLPRKEFWGSGDDVSPGGAWLDPLNWSGNRLPDADDDVYVRSGGVVQVGGAAGIQAEARTLIVGEATTLALEGGALRAAELHLYGGARFAQLGGTAVGERLVVDPAAAVLYELDAPANAPLAFLQSAHLAGTLELGVAPGHAPAIGEAHRIVVTQTLSGGFDRLVLAPSGGLEGMDVLLEEGTIELPGADPLATLSARVVHQGDANADGVVDQADLDAVLLGWGREVPPASVQSGDLDGSARIDQADLDRVLLNWGRSGHISTKGAAIPEPSGLLLCLACTCLWLSTPRGP